jgi:iron complex outermembrane receptor protein
MVRTTGRRQSPIPGQDTYRHEPARKRWLALAVIVPIVANATDVTDMSLEELMQVSVIGASKYAQKQSEVAAAVSIITREEIKAFGWRTLDEALATLPGIYTTYDRQFVYLGVRGFGLPGDYNTRVLITINGNRVNDPVWETGPFGRRFPVDMDMIERIEFIPGPGGAVYGQDAMLAVINIVTRTGAQVNGAEVSAGYQAPQEMREARASFGDQLDNGVDFLMSVSDMSARGQNLFFNYGATGISGIATGMDGDHSQQFLGSVARGPWTFETVYGFDHKDDPTASYFGDPLVPVQYIDTTYTLTQLQYQDSFAADTLHVSARLFTGDAPMGTLESTGGTHYSYPTWSDWRGIEARVVSTAYSAHTLMLGLEAQDDYAESQDLIDWARPSNDIYQHTTGYRAGVYGQDEWRLSSTLTSTLGLRVDHNNVTGSALSPRLGFIWQAAPDTTTKLLYGSAHRTPSVNENSNQWGPGPPQLGLGNETIDTLEFDVDQRVGRDLTLRASVYQWTLHDPLVVPAVSVTGDFQNTAPIDARGIELSSDRTWDSGVRLRDSVSVQRADYAHGGDIVNSPKLLGKLNFSSPLPAAGMRLGYELHYEGSRLTLDGTTLGGYALSNIYLSMESLVTGLELALAIDNLGDKRYAQPAAPTNWQNSLEQDGRSVRIKASYRFGLRHE